MKRVTLVLMAILATAFAVPSLALAKSATLQIMYRSVGQSANETVPFQVETTLSTTKVVMKCVPGVCSANITAPLPGYAYNIYYAITRKDTGGWEPDGQLIVNGVAISMRNPANASDHAGWRAHNLTKDGKVANIAAGTKGFEVIPNQQLVPFEIDAYIVGGCSSNIQIKGDWTYWQSRPMDQSAFRQAPIMASYTTTLGIPTDGKDLEQWFQILDGNTGAQLPPECVQLMVPKVPCYTTVPYSGDAGVGGQHKRQYRLLVGAKGMQDCQGLMP